MNPTKPKTLWRREDARTQGTTHLDRIIYALKNFGDDPTPECTERVLTVLQAGEIVTNRQTMELLGAVENTLENVKLALIKPNTGTSSILHDVAKFLHETSSSTQLDQESAELDELLERLDFVASGGSDAEVRRVPKLEASSQSPMSFVPDCPVQQPKNFEDPKIASHAQRLQSLSAILSLREPGEGQSFHEHQLLVEQAKLAEYCLRTALLECTVELRSFCDEFVQEVAKSLTNTTDKPKDFIHCDYSAGYVYRSVAKVFGRQIRDLATLIGGELISHKDSKLHLQADVDESFVTFTLDFIGVRTAFDLITQRMEELSARPVKDAVFDSDSFKERSNNNARVTRKENIARSLVQLRQLVERTQGLFEVCSEGDYQLKLSATLPIDTRILHTLPVVIQSTTFVVETHYLVGVVTTSEAQWDVSQTHIQHSNHSYRRCSINAHRKSVKTNQDSAGWILLLEVSDRKLALEVEAIGEPELQVYVPSRSEIQHGHQFIGGDDLKLLLDPMELVPVDNVGTQPKLAKLPEHHLLCFNVSSQLIQKICRCFGKHSVLVRKSSSLANTVLQLQEFCPDYLVIEDSGKVSHTTDAIAQIVQSLPSLTTSVLVFADEKTLSINQLKNDAIELKCLAKNVDFNELKKCFESHPDSEESDAELARD